MAKAPRQAAPQQREDTSGFAALGRRVEKAQISAMTAADIDVAPLVEQDQAPVETELAEGQQIFDAPQGRRDVALLPYVLECHVMAGVPTGRRGRERMRQWESPAISDAAMSLPSMRQLPVIIQNLQQNFPENLNFTPEDGRSLLVADLVGCPDYDQESLVLATVPGIDGDAGHVGQVLAWVQEHGQRLSEQTIILAEQRFGDLGRMASGLPVPERRGFTVEASVWTADGYTIIALRDFAGAAVIASPMPAIIHEMRLEKANAMEAEELLPVGLPEATEEPELIIAEPIALPPVPGLDEALIAHVETVIFTPIIEEDDGPQAVIDPFAGFFAPVAAPAPVVMSAQQAVEVLVEDAQEELAIEEEAVLNASLEETGIADLPEVQIGDDNEDLSADAPLPVVRETPYLKAVQFLSTAGFEKTVQYGVPVWSRNGPENSVISLVGRSGKRLDRADIDVVRENDDGIETVFQGKLKDFVKHCDDIIDVAFRERDPLSQEPEQSVEMTLAVA